jgi:hypothetical protein
MGGSEVPAGRRLGQSVERHHGQVATDADILVLPRLGTEDPARVRLANPHPDCTPLCPKGGWAGRSQLHESFGGGDADIPITVTA